MMRTWFMTMLVCLVALPAAAQQECIPVHALDQEHLAFKSGEELQLVLHYKWGAINADVGKASITIDSTSVDGVSCYTAGIPMNLMLRRMCSLPRLERNCWPFP